MKILATIYLWLLIGDFVCALGRWGYEERAVFSVIFWPRWIWFTAMNLIHDWRKDLYYRTKHI